jgi:hypothetical protein|tara:strand:+ start:151 stop:753 length:603 start_codon:yes stop_codon:yes gene_type:complete
MGFDIYGLNPKVKEGSVKPTINWDDAETTQEEKEAYLKALDKYEDENVGEYFRNNVWWWRRLAQYVYENTGEVTEDEYNEWHMNSGHKVDEDKAIRIADTLEALIKQGHTAEYQMTVEKMMNKADKHNAEIEKELKALREKVIKITGNKDIAPADYPEDYNHHWEQLYNQKSWNDSYPFTEENVQAFANFCRQSGGFEIC